MCRTDPGVGVVKGFVVEVVVVVVVCSLSLPSTYILPFPLLALAHILSLLLLPPPPALSSNTHLLSLLFPSRPVSPTLSHARTQAQVPLHYLMDGRQHDFVYEWGYTEDSEKAGVASESTVRKAVKTAALHFSLKYRS